MSSSFTAPLKDLTGKVAFITGGSSGIGLGIARACAAAGMRVVITYLTKRHLDEASRQLREQNADFHAIELDVTDRRAVSRAAHEAEQVFGAVNLLCNNAGVGIAAPIAEATFGDWDYAMAVNVGGVINSIHSFLPKMIAHGQPAHIVTTSSMSGLFHGGQAGVYTTTKFAVVGLMEALRAELTPKGIGVSVFCPGLVKSNIFLTGRNRPVGADGKDRRYEEEKRQTDRMAILMSAGMDPLECGKRVLRGIQRNDMYVLTHPEYRQGIVDRFEALVDSFPDEVAPPERVGAERNVLRHDVYKLENDRRVKP